MGNIFNYITKYADNTFDEMPFNEVDAVMLSAIAYVDFSKIVNNDNKEVEMGLALEKFINRTDIKKYSKKGFLNKDLFRMCKMIKDKIRYRNIMLKNYVYILTKEEQFGAITMILPDKTKIIAYEGTDHNLVSWEEDFAMFYKYPVPADVDAIKYAKENISLFDKKVILLGHSKGGHLAMTATAFSPWYIRMKIDTAYNIDGPGFRAKELESRKYKMMEKKLEYIVPDYSFFGMLLRHRKKARVIKSFRKDIYAHSMYNWEVQGTRFVDEPLSTISRNLSRSIILWLEMHNDQEREAIVKDIFDYLRKSGISYIGDAVRIKYAVNLIKNLDELDDETKMLIKHFVKFNVKYHLDNMSDDVIVEK